MQDCSQKNQRESYDIRSLWGCFHSRRRLLQFLILMVVMMFVFLDSGDCDYVIKPSREQAIPATSSRRALIGSAPPDCRFKCRRCSPCVSVKVSIHPGTATPQDYYPEVWKCKCKSRLYNPWFQCLWYYSVKFELCQEMEFWKYGYQYSSTSGTTSPHTLSSFTLTLR